MKYKRGLICLLLLAVLFCTACRGEGPDSTGGGDGPVTAYTEEQATAMLDDAEGRLAGADWTLRFSASPSDAEALGAVRALAESLLADTDVEVTLTQSDSVSYTITLSIGEHNMKREIPIKATLLVASQGADAVAIRPNEKGVAIGEPESNVLPVYTCATYVYSVDTQKGQGYKTVTVSTVGALIDGLSPTGAVEQTYTVKGADGVVKERSAKLEDGDVLSVSVGDAVAEYVIAKQEGAVRGAIEAVQTEITAGQKQDLHLKLYTGLRSPQMKVVLYVPAGIGATMDNTSVNVIGRGQVKLSELATQSMGKTFDGYDHDAVGTVNIETLSDNSQIITFSGLDLRAENGQDLDVIFHGVMLEEKDYDFGFYYVTADIQGVYKPSYESKTIPSYTSPKACVTVKGVSHVADFARVISTDRFYNVKTDYTAATFTWTAPEGATSVSLMTSADKGATWREYAKVNGKTSADVSGLAKDTEHWFRLEVKGGRHEGVSNVAKLYAGMLDVTTFGAKAGDSVNDAKAINEAIEYLSDLGGGTLLFKAGTFYTTTIHLKSNVYLYIDSAAVLSALKGMDAPELTWWSDRDYRSGTSATAIGPYSDPCNYLTKQDVGHTYFDNAMFTAERENNIKIIGTGKITGNGNLVTSDKVMDNTADNRADKMFSLKLCTNVEIGGLYNPQDLWYYETSSPNTDEPFYVDPEKAIDKAYIEKALTAAGVSLTSPTRAQLGAIDGIDTNIDNMLHIERGGHFVLLATGCDTVTTHDTYADKTNGGVRDIFDYMACNDVYAINIYAAGSSDDIVKPGSDVSLGFTRPVSEFKVRNIIGDTNCNLFQIGSETADDIQNIFVDNIYVLAANKAGFSISTNDGAYVKNIFLNAGGTNPGNLEKTFDELGLDGSPDTSRYAKTSEMRRTRTPFFISISNRGRTMGGKATRYNYDDGTGQMVDQLLSDNVAIGRVEGIKINNVAIEEVYGGSRYNKVGGCWEVYGTQNRATAIISGYAVPTVFTGGRAPKPLPSLGKDGVISTKVQRQSADIENISFTNVSFLYKGGNPLHDAEAKTPEMAVGKYNVGDLAGDANGSRLPAYGMWFRHVTDLTVTNCDMALEKNDDRYAIVLDDVKNATFTDISMIKGNANRNLIELRKSSDITVKDSVYYAFGGTESTPIALNNESTEAASAKFPYGDVLSDNVNLKVTVGGAIVSAEDGTITLLIGTAKDTLLEAIAAEDGSKQTYALTDTTLTVTAADGKNSRTYKLVYIEDIRLKRVEGSKVMAISGSSILVEEGATEAEIRAGLQVPAGATFTMANGVATVSKNGNTLQYTIGFKPAELVYDVNDGMLIQGENGNYTKDGITDDKTNTSGATIDRQFTGAAGAYVEYTVTGLSDGYYVLRYGYKLKTANRTTTDVLVNGNKVGDMNHLTSDASKENLYTYTDYEVGYITGGTATVRFVITGPTASFMVDYFVLIPIKSN